MDDEIIAVAPRPNTYHDDNQGFEEESLIELKFRECQADHTNG